MILLQQIKNSLIVDVWWSYLLRIALYFLLAWLVHRISRRLSHRLVNLNRFTPRRLQVRSERVQTLESLIASTISFIAFATVILFSLNLFVDGDTLVWMVGLFSAAFGFGAKPLISDFLTGVGFLFEDPYDVGEKVEILDIEGVVEELNLRSTLLRAPTGETYFVPNGEIRVIRNFSRGRFSMANITLKVAAVDLDETLNTLSALNTDALHLLPNLLEPWQVISETGALGSQTELTLVTKARYGMAAEMRPRLLALVQQHLAAAGITLVD